MMIGDAFQADKKEPKLYGVEINDLDVTLTKNTDKTPESKTNTVSIMKIEAQNKNWRNLLTVTDTFICYSIKKTLLRIINTRNSEKSLLRGHENEICDLKFSNESNAMCSVDDGDNGPHIFIWKVNSSDGSINPTPISTFFIPANIVQPNPKEPAVWLVGTNKNRPSFGILTVIMNEKIINQYSDLPAYVTFEDHEKILDISWSDDGKYIATALGVDDDNEKSKIIIYHVKSASSPLSECFSFFASGVLSLRFTRVGLIAASRNKSSDESVTVLLQVYSFDVNSKDPEDVSTSLVQTIRTDFILYREVSSALSVASSQGQHDEIFDFNICCDQPDNMFLILSHRKSQYIGCFAINSLLKSPSRSAQSESPALPLYRMTMIDLKYPVESIGSTIISGRDHHSAEEIEHLEIVCYQPQPAGQSAIQQYHIPTQSLRHTLHPKISLPNLLSSSGSVSGISLNTPSPGLDVSSLIGSSNDTSRDGSILRMIKGRKSNRYSDRDDFLDLKLSNNHSSLSPSALGLNDSPTPVKTPNANTQSKSILGLLKGVLTPNAPDPANVNRSVDEAKEQEADDDADDEGDMVINDSTGEESGSIRGSNLDEMQDQSNWRAASITATGTLGVADLRELHDMMTEAKTLIHELIQLRNLPNGSGNNQNFEENDLIQRIATTVQSQMKGSFTELQAALKDSLKPVIEENNNKLVSQISTQIGAAVRKSVEIESKKFFDATLKSKPWIDEVAKGLSDSIRQDIINTMAMKLPDAVSGAVKETVRLTLSSSFRQSFESSLLPSFQVGTERMFAQVRETFENGIDNLQDQVKETFHNSSTTTKELKQEITSLKSTITALESKIDSLSKGLHSESIGHKKEKKIPDPLALLAQGRIPEALECALEFKNVGKLIELLGAMTGPSQLSDSCDRLLQLCAIQQLAADFAVAVPTEGTDKRLEWIKSLVMTLLFSSQNQSLDAPQMRQVLSSIFASLRAAETRISAGLANGTEPATIANVTDLKMVLALLGPKC